MEARAIRILVVVLALCSLAATYRTRNFIVAAPTAEIAKQVGDYGEHHRVELAKLWLGKALPNWKNPCMVRVTVGQMGAGGETNFVFDRGEVSGWDMRIQGPLDRILDSVLPHEVCHTIFACHFRRPLPRWADEGAATLSENESERRRQMLLCREVLGSAQQIDFRTMLQMMDYPKQMRDVLSLYAQGYVLCDLLVQKGGRKKYLDFLEAGHRSGWENAVQAHYGYRSSSELEQEWKSWIVAGCPAKVETPPDTLLVDNSQSTTNAGTGLEPQITARSQSPEDTNVDVTDVAAANPLTLPANPSDAARLGATLEAPDPSRRARGEPKMLAQVDLGTGQDVTQIAEGFSPPSLNRPPRASAPARVTNPEARTAAPTTQGREVARPRQTGPTRLHTPPLSLTHRPQLGARQAFPTAE